MGSSDLRGGIHDGDVGGVAEDGEEAVRVVGDAQTPADEEDGTDQKEVVAVEALGDADADGDDVAEDGFREVGAREAQGRRVEVGHDPERSFAEGNAQICGPESRGELRAAAAVEARQTPQRPDGRPVRVGRFEALARFAEAARAGAFDPLGEFVVPLGLARHGDNRQRADHGNEHRQAHDVGHEKDVADRPERRKVRRVEAAQVAHRETGNEHGHQRNLLHVAQPRILLVQHVLPLLALHRLPPQAIVGLLHAVPCQKLRKM
mmetsp:Transcript_12159/g.36645  ORF Transcript_12159/g.36645 Transcript_12159/m.36645 type:complete len:263 (+) Transcript_12159:126-914(+)